MMHRLTLGVASVLTIGLTAGLWAQQPAPAGFSQVVEVRVKPGHQGEFERWMKDLVAAAGRAGSPQYWTTFESGIGREGTIYRVVLPFAKWGERDAWMSVRDILVKAHGEAQANQMLASTATWSDGVTMRIWQNLPDGTANPTSQPANFYQVTIREVKPGMAGDYQALTAKLKAAYEASPTKLTVLRSVLRIGESSGTTFRRAQAFNTWSELDGANVQALLSRHFGEQEWVRMRNALQNMVVRQDTFISILRPELSRMPTTS